MFGLLDRTYAKKEEGLIHEDVDWHPSVYYKNSSPEIWYCFVPKIVARDEKLRKGILPNDGKVTTYVISSLNFVVSNPEEFVNNLKQVYDDAMLRINEDMRQWRDINLLGISLGVTLSIKVASSLPNKRVKNLVSLVGGARLGLSAWDSILTSHIVKNRVVALLKNMKRKLLNLAL